MWASGDYPGRGHRSHPELGPILVDACGSVQGDRVLDVAAGTGNAAIPAALAGAEVVASDLTPELFEAGRRQAATAGAELEWQEADAEALPFDDGDVRHRAVLRRGDVRAAPPGQPPTSSSGSAARRHASVCVSWTPSGFIGQMFATMKPYAPPPPPGAQPPPLWGDEDHVRALLGDRVTDVVAPPARRSGSTAFAEPADFREYFKTSYGPTIAAYQQRRDAERVAALDADLAALAERFDVGDAGHLRAGVGVPAADLSPRLSRTGLVRTSGWSRIGFGCGDPGKPRRTADVGQGCPEGASRGGQRARAGRGARGPGGRGSRRCLRRELRSVLQRRSGAVRARRAVVRRPRLRHPSGRQGRAGDVAALSRVRPPVRGAAGGAMVARPGRGTGVGAQGAPGAVRARRRRSRPLRRPGRARERRAPPRLAAVVLGDVRALGADR